MRRAASTAVSLVLTASFACSGGTDVDVESQTRTVAFLRAVATGGQTALFAELRRAGWAKGQNLSVLDDDPSVAHPIPADAEAAVRRWVADGVDLIFAFSTSGAKAAAAAAPGVPVVTITNDPVATGLVADALRPDGSITGVTFRVPADRTLDVAVRALGADRRLGLVAPAADPAAAPHREAMVTAARELRLPLEVETFTGTDDDAASAVDRLASRGVTALVVSNSPTAIIAAATLVERAVVHRMPVIANSTFVRGASVVLEPDTAELDRQLGRQAARLLAGTAVADVPVEDPRRYRIVLDLAAAAGVGAAVAEAVLEEAEEVRR